HADRRARHGYRHGPGRSRGGDGVRPEDRRGPTGRDPEEPGGARSLSGRRGVSEENAMTQQQTQAAAANAPSNAIAKNPVLEVKDLSVSYEKVEALSGASITVGEGQIVTVIGPSGAGKTTMLSAIMGVLGCKGPVAFDGTLDVVPEVERMVARGMNLVPEKRELFGEMSVEDNLVLGAFQRYRMGKRDHKQTLEEVYALFPRLKERRDQAAGTMSGGERQMLAVGRALMAKPKLLML